MALLGLTHPLASVTHAKLLFCVAAFFSPTHNNYSVHKDSKCKLNTGSR